MNVTSAIVLSPNGESSDGKNNLAYVVVQFCIEIFAITETCPIKHCRVK